MTERPERHISSASQEDDCEGDDGPGRPVENSLGENHRKCILQKKDVIQELRKQKYIMWALRRVKRFLFMCVRFLK